MTLFQKDFNVDKMLAELKTPYDDIPKHKLRKLLIERDEEITTHIAEIRTLEKSDRLLEMAKRKLKKLNKENKELQDRNKWLKEEIKAYERGCKNHGVITNNLQGKLKELNKEKDAFEKEFYFTLDCQVKEGDKYEEEIDKLREVILDLNQQLRASHEVSAVHIKRATELTSMEMEIDKVCSRIQTPDNLGHLMGNTTPS